MEETKYQCDWQPEKDITTYELAQCVPLLMSRLHSRDEWDKLDESITRHFVVRVFNYGDMIRETGAKLKELMKE